MRSKKLEFETDKTKAERKQIHTLNTTLSFSRSSPRFYPGLLIKSQLRKLVLKFITQNSAQKRYMTE